MDPDPGGPKTRGSGGSGFGTLLFGVYGLKVGNNCTEKKNKQKTYRNSAILLNLDLHPDVCSDGGRRKGAHVRKPVTLHQPVW